MESRLIPLISSNGSAAVIGQLDTGREGNFFQPGGEICCSFAPDESRFAWSSGFRKVVLVPWNRYKNCLISDASTDANGNLISSERISIDCGFQVISISFGAGTPEGDLFPSKKDYWTRFDYSKDLILATGHSNGRIRIWDPYTGKLLLELTDHRRSVTCLSFTPDGSLHLASGSEDGTIKIWDLQDDGNMFKTLSDAQRSPVKDLSWSPDSQLLCSVGLQQKVYLWDMKEYEMKNRLVGHYNDILSCCFSPDGALVATASRDTRVILWSTETGKLLRIFGHVNPSPGIIYMAGANDYYVTGVAFSPNGLLLVSTCTDGYLRFWSLNGDEPELAIKSTEDDSLQSCSYSPSGGTVAVSYTSGDVKFYLAPFKLPKLLHLSRMAFRRAIGSHFNGSDWDIPRKLIEYLQYHF